MTLRSDGPHAGSQGLLLTVRKGPTWVKLPILVLAIGVLSALCVYRWYFI